MPEDSKKNHDKKKSDPKDQRRPRQRHQQSGAEKKSEKKAEEPKNFPKVAVPQKPVYESPPPEFYKNLKRETDEILKITEEENTKYKKKEIQSNWSKYEMPIDSYEEIEEHDVGADYEKLIQAPLSIGGHFQFKHEKSWDINTGPSLYDKYFDINMEDLNMALCSISFYERNSIPESNFSQTDILTMNNRATRFKQKYYNDKSYSTPEMEAQEKILNKQKESMKEDNVEREKEDCNDDIEIKYDNDRKTTFETDNIRVLPTDINLELKSENTQQPVNVDNETVKEIISKQDPIVNKTAETPNQHIGTIIDSIENDDIIFGDTCKPGMEPAVLTAELPSSIEPVCHSPGSQVAPVAAKTTPVPAVTPTVLKVQPAHTVPKVAVPLVDTKKNPVIESPEDLEKWLDDFLDG